MEVLTVCGSSELLVPPLCDLLDDNVLGLGAAFRGGITTGDKTPSADCHDMVSMLPLNIIPSDTAYVDSKVHQPLKELHTINS